MSYRYMSYNTGTCHVIQVHVMSYRYMLNYTGHLIQVMPYESCYMGHALPCHAVSCHTDTCHVIQVM